MPKLKQTAKPKRKPVARPKRHPKEDFNQATHRVFQEIARRSES